jgi:hypothetical protein
VNPLLNGSNNTTFKAGSIMITIAFINNQGRTASYPTASSQIPACGTTAPRKISIASGLVIKITV